MIFLGQLFRSETLVSTIKIDMPLWSNKTVKAGLQDTSRVCGSWAFHDGYLGVHVSVIQEQLLQL